MNTPIQSPNYIRLQEMRMSMTELDERLTYFKGRLWQHIEERNSYNLNQSYVQFLESRIEEIKKLIFNLKLANKKAA